MNEYLIAISTFFTAIASICIAIYSIKSHNLAETVKNMSKQREKEMDKFYSLTICSNLASAPHLFKEHKRIIESLDTVKKVIEEDYIGSF